MMETSSNRASGLLSPDAEREQLIAELYYYRSSLAETGGDELAIYFVEMTIAALTLQSKGQRSP